MRSWNARSAVAAVSIDASQQEPRIRSSEHTSISQMSGGHGIQWTQLDDALPLPFSQWQTMWGGGAAVGLVIKCSDITAVLNAEPLRITGLKQGVYALRIDGQKIGAFNSDELAAGINLAVLDTPMSVQAMKVYDAVVQHSDLHNVEWRTIQVPLSEYNLLQSEPAMNALNALEEAVTGKAHDLAQPRPHNFELIPIS